MHFKINSLLLKILILMPVIIAGACSSTRHVGEDQFLLDKVKITIDDTLNNKELKGEEFLSYIRQQPNHKTLWSVKLRLGIYNMSGSDSTKWWNKWVRKIGEPPVIFDSTLTSVSVDQLRTSLINRGYMNAKVEVDTIKKKNKKATVEYLITPGQPHKIKNFNFVIEDSAIASIISPDTLRIRQTYSDLLDRNKLDELRSHITRRLRNQGYFNFVKENISFIADTTENSYEVDLSMVIHNMDNGTTKHSRPSARKYLIRRVVCVTNYTGSNDYLNNRSVADIDSVDYKGMLILYGGDKYLRPSVIYENSFIQAGRPYSEWSIDRTYKSFSRLEILKFINIRFEPVGNVGDTDLLDAYILLTPGKTMSMTADLEGTNSEGDLGLAVGLSFTHRNIGKGSETLTVKARGAYEAIHGDLEGLLHNRYMEYSLDAGIQFPKFMAPFLKEKYKRRINASTDFHASMNFQQRPEYTRIISTIGWAYNWTERQTGNRHIFTPLDINYVYLPESTNDFINNIAPDNPLLRYSYEDHFIMRMGYSFYHTNKRSGNFWNQLRQRNIYTIRINAEFAGNLLFLINSLFTHRSDFHSNPYKIFGIQYSQYFKFDSNFAFTHIFDERQSLSMRLGLGVGVPYGNSGILPFEKRFYGGGANGVRGWAVRTLGPGAYRGTNQAADYMNQCGDIRFIFSSEYRAKLFWIVELGAFIDIGNIWTIRDYPAQLMGLFKFDSFYKQLAAAYGLGIRLDFDYFLLRFDLGMKAHNPAFGEEPWPLIHPKWGRDRAFHFSIGYPF